MTSDYYVLPARGLLLPERDVLVLISRQEASGSGRDLGQPLRRRTGVQAEGPLVLLIRAPEGDGDFVNALQRALATAPHPVPVVFGTDSHPASHAESFDQSGNYRHAVRALPALTRRQIEVLKAMAEGVTEREIARRLGISERTVQLHVANISRALGVCSHFQLGLAAARLGLL